MWEGFEVQLPQVLRRDKTADLTLQHRCRAPGHPPAPRPETPIAATLEKIKHLPIFVLQGDDDGLVTLTRQWVAKMQELGMQHVYVEIPGGDHSLVISQNSEHMGKFLDFFNIVRKKY